MSASRGRYSDLRHMASFLFWRRRFPIECPQEPAGCARVSRGKYGDQIKVRKRARQRGVFAAGEPLEKLSLYRPSALMPADNMTGHAICTAQYPRESAEMVWTEEMMNTLKTLWSEGKSASEIAEILGQDISRNAVIGKAHRLGVSGRPSPIKKKTGQPLTLLSMTERMCKWPFGDPKKADFHFCGRPVAATITYCPEHRSIAYQAARKPLVAPR